MIAKLMGQVEQIGADHLILMTPGGVGYLVFASRQTLSRLSTGGQASLLTEAVIRETDFQLFGFQSGEEQDWFRLLVTVQGVGAKVALAILSVLEGPVLLQALLSQDKKAVSQASGVGPKLAARIVSELKDKVGSLALSSDSFSAESLGAPQSGETSGNQKVVTETVSALENLGYGRSEAFKAVQEAQSALGSQATLEQLIGQALKTIQKF